VVHQERVIKIQIGYKYYDLISQVMSVKEPLNFEKTKDHKDWMNSMKEEYDSTMKNDTWELA